MSMDDWQTDITEQFCETYIIRYFTRLCTGYENPEDQVVVSQVITASVDQSPDEYQSLLNNFFPGVDEASRVLRDYLTAISDILHGAMNNELGQILTTSLRDQRFSGTMPTDEELGNEIQQYVRSSSSIAAYFINPMHVGSRL